MREKGGLQSWFWDSDLVSWLVPPAEDKEARFRRRQEKISVTGALTRSKWMWMQVSSQGTWWEGEEVNSSRISFLCVMGTRMIP